MTETSMRVLPVLRGSCTMCGDCCRVITLNKTTVDRIKSGELTGTQAPGGNDPERCGQWIRDELTEISNEEADLRRPGVGFLEHGGPQGLYKCSNFDEQTNKCARHHDKPSICSGFPWYGNYITHHRALDSLPHCGYKIDVLMLDVNEPEYPALPPHQDDDTNAGVDLPTAMA